jgi:HK97 family phage major capsid protein
MATKEELEAKLDGLEKAVKQKEKQVLTPKGNVNKALVDPNRVPHIREGENPLSSRPMYMFKAALVATRNLDASEAKLELEFSGKLKKALQESYGQKQANYGANAMLIPLSWSHLPEELQRDSSFAPYRKSLHEAVAHLDPDEMICRKSVEVLDPALRKRIYKTSMSYIDQQSGGALVAPEAFGDLITILRNKAVLPNIGARNVPLPAQGSIRYPRQTGVSQTNQVPENTAGTESNPTFDDIVLEPKQFICLVRASNQLLTFSPGLAEATIREDMAEQAALTFDLAGLEGSGGPNRVKGIINQTGITSVTSKVTGANGDSWSPVDTARMLRAAMTRNSDIKTWVMRPDMWLGITETRADAVTPGDSQGNYLFNMLREFSADFGDNLRQRKVVTSNQVSASRTKGSASNLTYILGLDGQEIIVGMHGAMVLDANPYETTAYTSNQTLMRAILFGDVQIRRGAGVVLMDDLIVPNLDA